jgi:hypothetical protein
MGRAGIEPATLGIKVRRSAGLGALASLGAKALRGARERRETLQTSDYRIVYRMSRA